MPTRREFLETSSAAMAAAVLAPALPAGPSGPVQAPAMPPSIQALSSQKSRARPISVEERRERIERALALLGAEALDGLFLTGGTSLRYFTGISWGLSERLLALILPRGGRAFVVCPAFERDRALEQIEAGPLHGTADVMVWEEHEDPYQRVADGLRARGIATGRLGVEETVRHVFASGAAAALPAMRLASGTPVTAGCRMVKDAHELELMRLASEVTLKAYEAAYLALMDGMKQDQIAALGAQYSHRPVCSGGDVTIHRMYTEETPLYAAP